MEVRIRLKRVGKKNQPIFRIVAQPRLSKRDGKELEKIGLYFPKKESWSEKVEINEEKLLSWIKKGATMSERVKNLYERWKRCRKS
ncbi:MAG: 30S ribosomal protein S16 [Caldiserica bacterium]|nr:MAG: 30S ribosomal protein S16 [Caldisericota bacterium]